MKLVYSMVMAVVLAVSAPAAADPLAGAALPQAKVGVVHVQYGDLCGNWRREFARLYGPQTQSWFSCMGQPQAVVDCQGGGRHGRSHRDDDDGDRRYSSRRAPVASCGTWKRECAKLWGWGTHRWNQCMGQPGALRSCS
jgi:hypothetical protein